MFLLSVGKMSQVFQYTLNIASNVMKTVLSNINILNKTDCHPRLRSHSVIKFVGKEVMISLGKVIETSF
jgi:hypothetical protein